jgi:hypothetical protein
MLCRDTGLAVLPVIPVAAWEFSLGVWLAFKGFRPSPITADKIDQDRCIYSPRLPTGSTTTGWADASPS